MPHRPTDQTTLQIIRARWHIEDTRFNRWIRYWNIGHVFRHTPNALMAVLLLSTLAFNLLQLFIYRRLGRCRRPKRPKRLELRKCSKWRSINDAGWSSLVARRAHNPKVVSSNLTPATMGAWRNCLSAHHFFQFSISG
jgi:hypothetical protein